MKRGTRADGAPDLGALTHPGPWHTDLRQGSGLRGLHVVLDVPKALEEGDPGYRSG